MAEAEAEVVAGAGVVAEAEAGVVAEAGAAAVPLVAFEPLAVSVPAPRGASVLPVPQLLQASAVPNTCNQCYWGRQKAAIFARWLPHQRASGSTFGRPESRLGRRRGLRRLAGCQGCAWLRRLGWCCVQTSAQLKPAAVEQPAAIGAEGSWAPALHFVRVRHPSVGIADVAQRQQREPAVQSVLGLLAWGGVPQTVFGPFEHLSRFDVAPLRIERTTALDVAAAASPSQGQNHCAGCYEQGMPWHHKSYSTRKRRTVPCRCGSHALRQRAICHRH